MAKFYRMHIYGGLHTDFFFFFCDLILSQMASGGSLV